ncbi:MAG: hypothetical protein U1E89_13495 [Burkholderiaceae bacterium]
MSNLHPLIAALLALASTFSGSLHAQAARPPAPQAADIQGQWSSAGPENYGSHHATRSFAITERTWQVRYQAFADPQAQQPLFTIRVAGAYALGDASAKVAGAREGIFPALSRSITADSEAGVQMFAGMGCPLERGRETFLLSTGCGFVPGLMQSMGEYDLIALSQGQLFFGDRAGDLSKARPEKLTPYPLLRRP